MLAETGSRQRRWSTIRGAMWLLLAALTLVAQAQETPPATPPTVIPAARQADTIVIIPIEGEISQVTATSLERRLKIAEDAQADAVVFELNTPGGLVPAALQICTAIKRTSVGQTIAWINPAADSAGVFFALACDRILVSPACTLGDAAPIAVSMGGVSAPTGTLRAKIESPILAEVVDSARRRGYDEKLVQSFIVPEMELWLIEHKDTGKQLMVDAKEFELVFGDEPESSAIPRAQSLPQADPKSLAERFEHLFRDLQGPGAGGPISRQEIEAEVEQAQSLRTTRQALTPADLGDYLLVEQVVDRNTLLTLKEYDILRYGLAEENIRNDAELQQYFGATQVDRLSASWSENLTVFFSMPLIRGVLIVLMLLAGLIEFSAPGVGLPGAVALVCLLLVIGAPVMAGMASWWEVAAILVGIVLILAEIFLIPGLGVAGISGLLLLLLGLVGTFVPNAPGHLLPSSESETDAALVGISTVLAAFFTVIVAAYFLSKHLHSFPLLGRLVLTDTSPRPLPGGDSVLEAMAPSAGGLAVGSVGKVVMPLRPSGKAEINGRLLDVVTEEGFIDSEARVRVTEVSSLRILVERVDDDASAEDAIG
ncbi:MAG: nodulation protein NfeD [Phycisphaerales bacterium JB038]